MKKIGNIFCFSIVHFLHVGGVYAQSMMLSIRDANNMPVAQCMTQVPYTLHIVMHDVANAMQSGIVLELPENIMSENSKSVSQRIENGRVTVTYRYTIVAKKEGIYTLGPARVKSNGATLCSNDITITVKNNDRSGQKACAPALVRLYTNKDAIYVGEDLECFLRFYYTVNKIALEQIVKPDNIGAAMLDWQGPYVGSQDIDGVTYDYIEWRWRMCYDTVGDYELPAFRADYTDTDKRIVTNNPFALFFNNAMQVESVYSNGEKITVKPLPDEANGVRAVGLVDDYSVKLDRVACQSGEAIGLSLIVTGRGNFLAIEPPSLSGIPGNVNYYYSKKERIASGDHDIYVFDYILHPLSGGVISIPAQEFSYFDVHAHAYKTIKSNAVECTVAQYSQPVIQECVMNQDDCCVADIRPLQYTQSGSQNTMVHYLISSNGQLAWCAFFFVLGVLGILFCGLLCYMIAAYWWRLNDAYWRKKKAFADIRKRVARLSDDAMVYYAWIDFFATCWEVKPTRITEARIKEYFERYNLPLEYKQEWDVFWAWCMQEAFLNHGNLPINYDSLRTYSLYWINVFKKYF